MSSVFGLDVGFPTCSERNYMSGSRRVEAMGNLRNAKCESAKGNLQNHVRKMRAKNG